jgi:hypothetical protein
MNVYERVNLGTLNSKKQHFLDEGFRLIYDLRKHLYFRAIEMFGEKARPVALILLGGG